MVLLGLLTMLSGGAFAETEVWRTVGKLPQAIDVYNRRAELGLPSSLMDEAEPQVLLRFRGFLPKIVINGVETEPDINLLGHKPCAGLSEPDCQVVLKTAALGMHLYQIHGDSVQFETAPGVYDFSWVDAQARMILALDPQAYFLLNLRVALPKWCERHPDDVIVYGAGPVDDSLGDERIGRRLRPSAASKTYREELTRLFAQCGEYARARGWSKRVVMVRPCWGIYTEWHCYGMYQSPDVGPAMTAAFHRWKGGKYANEPVPSCAERYTEGAEFLDPAAQAKLIDYYDCLANEIADLLVHCARELKRAFPGRLAGAYYGYVLAMHPPEGATVLLDRVLSAPEIDFLSDPSMYTGTSRRAGGAYYHRTIPLTYARHRKLLILEDDMRFHHIAPYCEKSLCTQSPRESRMTMRRNYLDKIFDCCGIQLNDPIKNCGERPNAYDDPDVLGGIHDAMRAFAAAGSVSADSGNRTAVVFSPRERLRRNTARNERDGSRLNGLVYVLTIEYLYKCGAAFDLMTLEDYLAIRKDYDRVCFPNLTYVTDAERAALKAKLRRPGVSAVWMTAPGSATDAGFSDAAMSDLTGIDLVGSGPKPQVRSTDAAAKPFPADGVVKTLAEGSTSVFLPCPPRGPQLWREVLAGLGEHLWIPVGDYFRRQGDVVMFHTARAADHAVVLPADLRGKTATELFSGRKFTGDTLSFKTDGPDTLLFKFAER